MSVFFRKVNINKERNSATVIVSSSPLANKKSSLAGMAVATQKTLNVGDELDGFQMTDNYVKDMVSGEPTTLVWVEAV